MIFSTRGLTQYLPALLLAGLLIGLPLLYLDFLHHSASFPRYVVIGLASGLLLLTWVIFSSKSPQRIVWHPLFLLLLLFAAWAFLSLFWSVDPSNTYHTALQLISFILFSFYTAQVATSESRTALIIYAAVAGGVLVSIIGIQQAYGLHLFEYRQSAPPASTFVNRNFAATYLDFITPLAFVAILFTAQSRWRWLLACCFAMILSYHLITTSRGAWLAMLVAFAVFIYFLFHKSEVRQVLRSKLRASFAPLIMASLLVTLILWIPFRQSPTLESKLSTAVTSSISVRLNANINALGMLADQPVTGVGYGAFMLGFRPYLFKYVPVNEVIEYRYLFNLHNDLLQLFVELGLPGGLLALVIYVWSILLALRVLQRGESDRVRLMGMGLLLALLAFGTHALVSFPLNKPTSALMFWVLVGLSIGLNSTIQKTSGRLSQLSKTIRLSVAIFAVCFFAINISHYLHYYNNHLYFEILEKKVVAGECDSALRLLEQIDFKTALKLRVYYPLAYENCRPDARTLLEKMNQVIDYDPNNTLARIVRGKVYLQNQQPQLAARDFLVVVTILPHRVTGYLGLGNAATQEGKYTLAKKLYRKALEIEPDNETAQLMLTRLDTMP